MHHIIISAAVAALTLAASPAAAVTTFNPYDSFPTSADSSTSPFAFGYHYFGSLVDQGMAFEAACDGIAQISCVKAAAQETYIIRYAGADPTFPFFGTTYTNDRLVLFPGRFGERPHISFVAPTSAEYSFVGEFSVQHATPSGVLTGAQLGRSYEAPLLLAEQLLDASTGARSFSFKQTLAAGDQVRFFIDRNGNFLGANAGDTTGLKLLVTDLTGSPGSAVPEPGTWALMILGFGLVGTFARRRRPAAA